MLKQLRSNTKAILWIVVVAFVISIFAVWGMNLTGTSPGRGRTPEIAGKVNGKPIPRRVYRLKLDQAIEQYKQQKGEDATLNSREYMMLANQAWEMCIRDILVNEQFEKLDIQVTDMELVRFLRNNPHPSLKNTFTDEEGNFDYQAYLNALSNPQADWRQLENWGRSVLPEIKLQTYITSQVHIPSTEVIEEFKKRNRRVKARYIAVPLIEQDEEYNPGEDEIRNLYQKKKEDFKTFEKRRVKIIEIPKEASKTDHREILDEINDIRREILSGKDFADAAELYSQDEISAKNSGDLGFFARGEMVPEFEEAAFSLQTGEISEPVKTKFGYHLIKVEEKKVIDGTEKVHARHILLKIEPGFATLDSIETLVGEVREDILNEGFEEAARMNGLEVKEPEPFHKRGMIDNFGYLPNVLNFAFNYQVNDISMSIQNENAFYFVKIMEKIPERIKTLEEVKDQLVENIRELRVERKTEEYARSIRGRILSGGSFKKIAREADLEVQTTPLFGIDDKVDDMPAGSLFAYVSHQLEEGELSPPIQQGSSFYIIEVTEIEKADMDRLSEERDEIASQLHQESLRNHFTEWYKSVRDDAEVVDNRLGRLN